jgi:malonyl CoA-acyl carrier protein transacylase
MKTVWMFPGADAIEDANTRSKAWAIEQVQVRVHEANAMIAGAGASLDLPGFMVSQNNRSSRWFQQLVVATVATQVGFFEYFTQSGVAGIEAPGLLIGCSLGDIARSVCAGAISFEAAVHSSFDFARHMTELKSGASFHVSSKEPFTPEFQESLLQCGVQLSVSQTRKHCLIAGPTVGLERWAEQAVAQFGFRIRPMYPYPLHSPSMNPVLSLIEHHIDPEKIKGDWKIPMFSTVHCKPVLTQDDLMRDLADNIVKTVRWHETFEALVGLGYRHFVNLGPSPTLFRFGQYSSAAPLLQLEDAFADALESAVAYA